MSKSQQAKSVPVYVASTGVDTRMQAVEENGKIVNKPVVYGSVNGEPFTVPCNQTVAVPVAVAEALAGLMAKQAERR